MTKINNSFSIQPIEIEKEVGFDKYYIDLELKEVFKKTGVDSNGDEIGIAEIKVIESKRDIKEFINSQNDDVGIEAYLRKLAIQGIELGNTKVNDDIIDLTHAPTDLIEAAAIGDNAKKLFNSLDPALTQGKSYQDFMTSLSNEILKAYIDKKTAESVTAKTEGGKE